MQKHKLSFDTKACMHIQLVFIYFQNSVLQEKQEVIEDQKETIAELKQQLHEVS